MRILLVHVDGSFANLALLRIAAHHIKLGDTVRLSKNYQDAIASLENYDKVYASAIFANSKPLVDKLIVQRPDVIVGGSAIGPGTLSNIGISENVADYSIYPDVKYSIGYTQRGCRFRCKFCVVPSNEGKAHDADSPERIWRGKPHAKQLMLLDNDFFGGPSWSTTAGWIVDNDFSVCLCQGVNLRVLTDVQAQALSRMKLRDTKFKTRRIYTAWDNPKDEEAFFKGLDLLLSKGVNPDNVMAYMLIGFWPGETIDDIEKRRVALRSRGVRPYPMPFRRTSELVGFQRWIVGAYDKAIPWAEWKAARYEPRNLTRNNKAQMGLFAEQDEFLRT